MLHDLLHLYIASYSFAFANLTTVFFISRNFVKNVNLG